MYCRKCGKQIPDDSRVCEYCGEEVVVVESSVSSRPQKNTIAIVGLIFACISPIAGWILGGIGLKRSNQGYGGKWIAMLALIVATINFALNVYFIYTGQFDELLKQFGY